MNWSGEAASQAVMDKAVDKACKIDETVSMKRLLGILTLILLLPWKVDAGWLVHVRAGHPKLPDSASIHYDADPAKGQPSFKAALEELRDRTGLENFRHIGFTDLLREEELYQEVMELVEKSAPRELQEAYKSAGNMHNPKMWQLNKPFMAALLETSVFRQINADLAPYGYRLGRPGAEKFSLQGREGEGRLLRGSFSVPVEAVAVEP